MSELSCEYTYIKKTHNKSCKNFTTGNLIKAKSKLNFYQPPLFLLFKTHKNKNKHLGGIIFLPDDQFDIKNVFIFIFMRLRKLKKRWLIYRPPGMKGLRFDPILTELWP